MKIIDDRSVIAMEVSRISSHNPNGTRMLETDPEAMTMNHELGHKALFAGLWASIDTSGLLCHRRSLNLRCTVYFS